jgi:hypothetical protein
MPSGNAEALGRLLDRQVLLLLLLHRLHPHVQTSVSDFMWPSMRVSTLQP